MSIPKESGKSSKPIAKCRQLSPKEKERLFNLYVVPNLKEIKRLTKYYTGNYQDVEDNYNYCLAQLFNYIGSYNPEQKLMTWIGITVKRACFHENKKRYEESQHWTDIEMCSMEDIYQHGTSMVAEAEFGNLIDNISDQMLAYRSDENPTSAFITFYDVRSRSSYQRDNRSRMETWSS